MRVSGYTQKDMATDNTVPEAVYSLRINKFEYKTPKDAREAGPDERGIMTYVDKDGKTVYPYCSADLVIQDEGEFYGRHVFDNYLSLAPNDDWKIRQLMKACEFGEDEELDTDLFIDRTCYGVVTRTKEGKGKDGNWYPAQNKVGRYMDENGLSETGMQLGPIKKW